MTINLFDNGEFKLEVSPVGDSFTVAASGLAYGLGFAEARDMVRSLPDDEKGYASKGSELVPTQSGDQKVWFVTEPGFYRAVGQRQIARIEDPATRNVVERFQNWIFRDVILQIRRTGTYQPPQEAADFKPVTYSLQETAALLRQQFWTPVSSAVELARQLRDAGLFKQVPEPKARHAAMFWFTGSAWNVQAYAVPLIAGRLAKARNRMYEQMQFHGISRQLQLEGMGDPA